MSKILAFKLLEQLSLESYAYFTGQVMEEHRAQLAAPPSCFYSQNSNKKGGLLPESFVILSISYIISS